MSGERRLTAEERRLAMYNAIRSYPPGTPLTIADLARELRRSPGHHFTTDLAALRHAALDAGCEITNCEYLAEQRQYVFYYLEPQNEQGLARRPLATRSASVATQTRNLGRHGEWLATNGESADDRAMGRIQKTWADGVALLAQAMADLQTLISKRK